MTSHRPPFVSALALLAGLSLGACDVPPDEADTEESEILNGVQDPSGNGYGSVAIRANGGHLCSGTLITNSWVMTSRHCFPAGDQQETRTITVHLPNKPSDPKSTFQQQTVTTFVRHPDDYGTSSQKQDLMLIKVGKPFKVGGSTKGFTRELWPREASELTGRTLDCAGFGPTTPGGPSGRLTTAKLVVSKVEMGRPDGDLITVVNPNQGTPSAGQIQLPGDSGGGCFRSTNGKRYLVYVQAGSSPVFTDAFGCGVSRQNVRDWVQTTLYRMGR